MREDEAYLCVSISWTSDSHEHQYARHDIMWKRPIEICNTAEVLITMALTLGPVYIEVQDPR